MNYTNNHNIPLPLAVFLATDHYDYVPNVISATTLLKPVKQIVLGNRIAKEDTLIDVADLVSSRMGTAIHTAIEQAWLNPNKALSSLGFSDKVIERIKINPEHPDPKDINVYMEKRSNRSIAGMTVSGKFDFVAEGRVQDFKSTSTYTYMNQTNTDKYRLQGSIYRWLNPDIITADTMTIHFIFTDWQKVESLKNKDYPPNRVHSQSIDLLSLEATDSWLRNKITQIKQYEHADEADMPVCTDEDLWRKPTVYKYYKDPNKTERSTKNFTTMSEATAYMSDRGNVGMIKEVKGQVIACRYCPAFAICKQKDALIASGDLLI